MEELRSLTAIEENILETPTDLILSKFQEIWKDVAALLFAVEDRKMDPKLVQVMGGAELVLRISFAIGGQIGSGEMNFCMPYDSLEQIMPREQVREKFLKSVRTPNKQETDTLRAALGTVPVRVSVQLGTTQLTLQEIMGLRPESVVRLEARVQDALPVLVEGEVKRQNAIHLFFGEKDGLLLFPAGVNVGDTPGDLAATQFRNQLRGVFQSWNGQVGADASLKSHGSFAGQKQLPAGVMDIRRVEAGRFQQYRGRIPGDLAVSPTHHPGQGYGTFFIGNNQHIAGEAELGAVQGLDKFTVSGAANDDFLPPDSVIVERVQGLAVLHHYIVGNINNIVYGPQAASQQSFLHPSR